MLALGDYGKANRRARDELGYSSMPVEQSLRDAWAWMTGNQMAHSTGLSHLAAQAGGQAASCPP